MMRPSTIKITAALLLVAVTLPIFVHDADSGKGSYIDDWEPRDQLPFDWSDWDQDRDGNGVDDLLQYDLYEIEGDGEMIGLNVHLSHYPAPIDVERILSRYPSMEFHHVGTHSTAVYLSAPREAVRSFIGSVRRDTVMIEYRPPVVNFLDISSPATRASLSDQYSPLTSEDLGYTGEGMVIAVIDSGVNNYHESLRGKYVYGVDFTDTPVIPGMDPEDVDGHGTHVAGTALGSGGNSGTYAGTAPDSELVDLRYARLQGDFTGNADQALGWLIDNHDEHGIVVTSCSWGSTTTTSGRDTTSRLVNQLVEEGVVVVVAAGNDGTQGLPSPASADGALTVGALNDRSTIDRSDDSHEWYSNRGPRASDGDLDEIDELKPDVLAPGTNIRSARHNSVVDYVDMTGTSMATPHVSGIVALMLQAAPDLTPSDVKWIIRDSAQQKRGASVPETDEKYNYRSGWGNIDSYGAVKRAQDLVSFEIDAPVNVRLNQPFEMKLTGHFTKTGYDTDTDTVEMEVVTPISWGPPSEQYMDPGIAGADFTLSSPIIRSGNWVTGGTITYTSQMEDVEPVLGLKLRPVGSVGDEEVISGSVSMNGIDGSVEPANVTITYDSVPPDLSVITTAIWFSDNLPEGGDEVGIHVRINNTGGTNVKDLNVHFLDGPQRTGRKIGEDMIDVDAFSSSIAYTSWEANPGLHAITVIVDPDDDVKESNEDNNTAERPITVLGVNPPPIAQLDVDPASGTTMTRFLFDGSGSTDTNLRGGNVVLYNFDFGDGEGSGWVDTPTIDHVFREEGSYTASLTVQDNGGSNSQNQAEVQLNVSEVQSDEMVLHLNSSGGLSIIPGPVGAVNITPSGSLQDIGNWGSDPVDRSVVLHTALTLELIIWSRDQQQIVLEAEVTADREVFREQWSLDHPGGINETFILDLPVPETEIQFGEGLELDIRASAGSVDAALKTGDDGSRMKYYYYFKENRLPEVDAGADMDVKALQSVSFEGIAEDPDGSLYGSRWDFDGDGEWDLEGDDVLRTVYDGYQEEGSYTARLEVTDNDGGRTSDTLKVTVRSPDHNYPPTITMLCPASSVTGEITIQGSSDDDRKVEKVEVRIDGPSGPENGTALPWSAATGTRSWSLSYDTRGLEDGNYMVSARAYDGDRYSEILSCWAYFENPNSPPEIERVLVSPVPLILDGEERLMIMVDVDDPDLPLDEVLVTANLNSIGGPNEAPLRDDGMGWDAIDDDNTHTISFTPSRIMEPGTYTINIIATDSKGETALGSATVELYSSMGVEVYMPDSPLEIDREYLFKVAIDGTDLVDRVLLILDNTTYELEDDGRSGDRIAGDGVYTRAISIDTAGKDVPYEVRVTAADGRELFFTSGSLRVQDVLSDPGEDPGEDLAIIIVLSVVFVLILLALVLVLVARGGRHVKVPSAPPPQYYEQGPTVISGEVVVAQVFEE